jgi:hypothetical protein
MYTYPDAEPAAPNLTAPLPALTWVSDSSRRSASCSSSMSHALVRPHKAEGTVSIDVCRCRCVRQDHRSARLCVQEEYVRRAGVAGDRGTHVCLLPHSSAAHSLACPPRRATRHCSRVRRTVAAARCARRCSPSAPSCASTTRRSRARRYRIVYRSTRSYCWAHPVAPLPNLPPALPRLFRFAHAAHSGGRAVLCRAMPCRAVPQHSSRTGDPRGRREGSCRHAPHCAERAIGDCRSARPRCRAGYRFAV